MQGGGDPAWTEQEGGAGRVRAAESRRRPRLLYREQRKGQRLESSGPAPAHLWRTTRQRQQNGNAGGGAAQQEGALRQLVEQLQGHP